MSFGGACPRPVAYTTLVALLLDELGPGGGSPTELLSRILDSTHDTARYLDLRAAEVDRLWGPGPLSFAETEQALLLGHLVHPTPKSRSEMSPADRLAYAPEAGARFRLHWFSVDADLVRHASATGTPAPDMAAALYARRFPRGPRRPPRPSLGGGAPPPPTRPRPPGSSRAPSSTSARPAPRSPPPRRCAPSTTRTGRGSSSSRSTCGSPTPCGSPSPRSSTGRSRPPAWPPPTVGDRARAAAPHFRLVHDPAYLTAPGPPRASRSSSGTTPSPPGPTSPPSPPSARTAPAAAPAGWAPSSTPSPPATAGRPPTSAGSGSPGSATWSCVPSSASTSTSACASRPTSRTPWSSWTTGGRRSASTGTARATSTGRRPTTTCAG